MLECVLEWGGVSDSGRNMLQNILFKLIWILSSILCLISQDKKPNWTTDCSILP